MAHAPRRTDVTGSALVRLLGRLAEAGAPASNQVFPERLSQWLGWADAIGCFDLSGYSAERSHCLSQNRASSRTPRLPVYRSCSVTRNGWRAFNAKPKSSRP